MQWNGLWLILALLVVLVGVLMVARSLRRANTVLDADELGVKTKYGLPIIPREDRQLPERDVHEELQDDEFVLPTQAASTEPVYQEPTQADGYHHNNHHTNHHTSHQAIADNRQADDAWASEHDDTTKYQLSAADMTFEQNSPILDRHLDERQQFEHDNDALAHAQEIITIVIMPQGSFAGLAGKKVLEIVRTYGMKYGAMNLFYRHENEDGTGDLWFCMAGMGHQGVRGFDLNALPEEQFLGLTLFLTLPQQHALRGFDSMVSVANMLAQDLSADLLDENNNLLDDAYFAKLRSVITDNYGN
ncbi:cell division protein ZipA C-terminal FtsZ-binding domain-containing protein [Moraxella marmotae]|uniref:cell division protein ZipA C-terminal FtsZ-binding domain-containing protein n=1 Tax=Moraxella marmotae TaxID=3344520 RepID=UPI0035F31912